MQFLHINRTDKLSDLANAVGRRNVDDVVVVNGLPRTRNIGEAYYDHCNQIISSSPEVTAAQKIALLNTVTSDSDVFETAGLMNESEWKVFKAIGALPGTLVIPDRISLPDSVDIVGGTGSPIRSELYRKAVSSLSDKGSIPPEIFDTFSNIRYQTLVDEQNMSDRANTSTFYDRLASFNIPWGKITLYETLSGESVDIPAYPEELEDGATASYQTMPDMLYQYEPWLTYASSGPRTNTFTFHLHRDMWTGDHRDGMANELIRFCEACCYPHYNGSAVYTARVRLFIDGSLYISGVLTDVQCKWSGPIGLDGFYLEFELSLTITEVSESAKSYAAVRQLGLKGV